MKMHRTREGLRKQNRAPAPRAGGRPGPTAGAAAQVGGSLIIPAGWACAAEGAAGEFAILLVLERSAQDRFALAVVNTGPEGLVRPLPPGYPRAPCSRMRMRNRLRLSLRRSEAEAEAGGGAGVPPDPGQRGGDGEHDVPPGAGV